MKWVRHKNLSEVDLSLLAGTDLLVKMMSCRLVVYYEPKEAQASMKDMGLFDTLGLYHVRRLQDSKDTLEILFERDEDRQTVEQCLTQFKMSI